MAIQIGEIAIGLVIVMVVLFIALMIGGLMSSESKSLFQDLNLSGTVWDTLRGNVESYSTTGLRFLAIGLFIFAISVVITIVMGIFGRGKGPSVPT